MFKIGNSKELPPIPDHLSEEGKDFIRLCLQRDPSSRPTAVDLLQHPFVRNAPPLEKSSASHPLEQLTAISCRTHSKVSTVYSCCSNVIFQLINLHALLACRCVFNSANFMSIKYCCLVLVAPLHTHTHLFILPPCGL